MKHIIPSAMAISTYGGNTFYTPPGIGSCYPAANTYLGQCPTAGVLSKPRFNLDAAPGSGKSITFTLFLNGVATSMAFTISNTDTMGGDAVHTVTVAAGDYVHWRVVCSTSISTTAAARGTITFEGTTSGQGIFLGALNNSSNIDSSNTYYQGLRSEGMYTEGYYGEVMPCAGKFKLLKFTVSYAPGTGKSRTLTLRVNGVNSTLTAVISDTATTATDSTHEVSVNAGDVVMLESAPSGNPTASRGFFGLVFCPTNDGEWPWFCPRGGPSTSVNRWTPFNDWSYGSAASCKWIVGEAITLKSIRVKLSTSPGIGKSFTFTAQKNESDTVLTKQITGSATTGNYETDIAIAADDFLDMACVPANSPNSTITYIGVTMYISSGPAGWTHIAKVNGVAQSNIAKICGVAKASIAKINGMAV